MALPYLSILAPLLQSSEVVQEVEDLKVMKLVMDQEEVETIMHQETTIETTMMNAQLEVDSEVVGTSVAQEEETMTTEAAEEASVEEMENSVEATEVVSVGETTSGEAVVASEVVTVNSVVAIEADIEVEEKALKKPAGKVSLLGSSEVVEEVYLPQPLVVIHTVQRNDETSLTF